jgi:hypothetical protein
MRKMYWFVVGYWVLQALFVLVMIREVGGASGWYVTGGLTVSLGFLGVIEGLYKLRKPF